MFDCSHAAGILNVCVLCICCCCCCCCCWLLLLLVRLFSVLFLVSVSSASSSIRFDENRCVLSRVHVTVAVHQAKCHTCVRNSLNARRYLCGGVRVRECTAAKGTKTRVLFVLIKTTETKKIKKRETKRNTKWKLPPPLPSQQQRVHFTINLN